jgi:hypothetical protein
MARAAAEKFQANDDVLMDKLPVPVGEADLPVELSDYSGYEDFDSSDLIIPRVKIIQPTSRKGTAGKFSMNLTEEEFDQMTISVIKASRSRVLWPPVDSDIEEPLCKSSDFLMPDASVQAPLSSACAEYVMRGDLKVLETVCTKAKWINNERPACNQVYNLLCLTSENVPFWIALSGSSIGPVKRFISAVALQRKKLWQFESVIATEERSKPSRHYVIRFGTPRQLSGERLRMVGELVIQLKNQSAQVIRDVDAMPSDVGSEPF